MTVMTPAPIDQPDDEVMLVPPSDLPENIHQPMEVVAQPENANNLENQPVEDPPSSRFTWRIDNFSRMNTKKLFSDIFVVGGYKWRVLIFPKGNNVDHLCMYLNVADSSNLRYGWSRYAQFSLGVVNQIHNKYSIRKDTQHQFNARESDWGFTSFMPLGELYDPSRGYLVNDAIIIEAKVLVRRVVDYWTYDSKETSYVGLKNQGATCYMNSILQTLYHIPYFRKHDVQELNRVLCEKLEDKMKGTVVEGTIQKLFEGHHMNYIECIDMDYKSTRKKSFYDLQLDVKGCRDVYASFDKYVEVERLEGDNNYHAEQNGLQEEVAKEFGIPVQFQRFWLWAKLQNHTYRSNRPLTPVEETQSVGQLKEVSEKVHKAELKFLEIELRPDLHPIAPPDKTKDDILLFFKLYEPEKEELRYVGRLSVKSTSKPAEILSKLNELAGYAPDVEIDLHESSWVILQAEVAQYINRNVRGVPYQTQAKTKPLNGLVQRLKGKTGRFRGNLCEKCVEYTGRTIISPDSDLKITEGIRITGPEDPYSDHVLKDLFDLSGTTNIAFTNGESIILVVDSRRTCIDTNEIAESEYYKFLDFSDSVPNIVGTQCGNAGICKSIPKHVREMVEKTGQTSVEDITRFIFEFLKTKSEDKSATEQRRDQARKTSTIIATFDCKGPRIFLVNCMNDGPLEIESGQYAFCGSGKNFARSVLESRIILLECSLLAETTQMLFNSGQVVEKGPKSPDHLGIIHQTEICGCVTHQACECGRSQIYIIRNGVVYI